MRLKKIKDPYHEIPPRGWAIPYTSPTGVKTTLYNIGTVAYHLGRTPQVIRKWEISGVIPVTPFRVKGNRMYSDEHIDALLECAQQSHIRPGVKIQDTAFSSHVYKEYERLYNLFFVNSDERKEG